MSGNREAQDIHVMRVLARGLLPKISRHIVLDRLLEMRDPDF